MTNGVAAALLAVLYLQPLGELPDADVQATKAALVEFYGIDVRILPREPLPQSAWYAPRKRWRAEKLVDWLHGRLPLDGQRVLGLTAADISTTKGRYEDWGVLGLGDLPGTAGVISSFRAHRRARGELQARERLAKVAVHEIGHTLGLDHCPTAGCLMHDAEGSVTSCDDEFDLCPLCRAKLWSAGYRLPAKPHPPWTIR
jgi:archaemetzincin